jgi:hypothetical protein
MSYLLAWYLLPFVDYTLRIFAEIVEGGLFYAAILCVMEQWEHLKGDL